MSDRVYAAVTDAALDRSFGDRTVTRARPYARGHSVQDIRVTTDSETEVVARATASGTSPDPYRVDVALELRGGQLEIDSRCSCPVGFRCKHGAALALVLRDRGARGDRLGDWESTLEALVVETDSRSGDLARPPAATGLALQFHLTLPSAGGTSRNGLRPGVRMRPMRTGARRSWIKSGAGWSDVRSGASLREQDPAQVDVLRRLQAALSGGRHSWTQVERPYLDDFGDGVWRDLVRARESGIHFQLARPLAELHVADQPVEVAIDLAGDDDHVVVSAGVEHDGTWWTGPRLMTVGSPPHGVALLTELPSRAAKGPAPHRVVLAPLDRRPSPETVRLLRGEHVVRVPRTQWTRFEESHLPRLRRGFTVGSRDGSVAIADAAVPRLRLSVTWSLPVRADLHWEWRYDGPTGARTWDLDSLDELSGLRDSHGERRLLTRLGAEHDLTGIEAAERGPAARQSVVGSAALDLVATTLPSLSAGEVVEVVENDRPEFREASGDPKIRFDAAPPPPGAEAGPTDWLDLQVRLTIEGEEIPLPDVLAALTLGHPRIVLPSGLHLASDRPELTALRELVDSAAELRERDGDGLGLGAHDLGLWAQLADLGIVDAQAQAWVARAQALRDLTTLPHPDPVGVVSTMRSYQLDGFHWLAFLHDHGLGGVLADDMGLGKTLQVLAMICHARAAGAGPFLVVAPTSVVSAWQSEATRHTPAMGVVPITASAARRGASLHDLAAGADVVVTTYTLLRLESDAYADLPWGGLVLDEAQQVKNHQSKTYQAVRRIEAPFKLAVTGTPFENRLMELWSLLSITAPGLYPWPAQFEEQVAKPVEKDGDEAALRRFRQRIRPFLLRRTKELVAADLPPKQEQVLEVQLGTKHRRVYDTHLQRERQKILGLVDDFARNRVAIFSSLTRLRQLALDAGLVDAEHDDLGSAKIDCLVEHLHEVVAEGHRALVFSQFTSFLGRVRDRLDREGIASSYLDGTTRKRGDVVTGFREGDDPVFLISLKAGGVGLTLTEADYVFVLDPWWNPATEAQAVDRAHRIGQLRPVMVYRLVAVDTIEEKVMELKARKAELFAQVVDGDGALSGSISAEDIRGLFGG